MGRQKDERLWAWIAKARQFLYDGNPKIALDLIQNARDKAEEEESPLPREFYEAAQEIYQVELLRRHRGVVSLYDGSDSRCGGTGAELELMFEYALLRDLVGAAGRYFEVPPELYCLMLDFEFEEEGDGFRCSLATGPLDGLIMTYRSELALERQAWYSMADRLLGY